jgi:predicted naringenin-chalcone synthase
MIDLEAAWVDSPIYDLPRNPHGAGSGARTRVFAELVEAYFHEAYASETEPPDELVHVTCTGYVSPSGAQQLVAARRWPTRVTHAYQMGCYAAVPALRMASGFLATARRIDIVHTELCSLHLDPTHHELDQLVVQSLFADGLIRYRVQHDTGDSGLRVVALHEQIVPGTADAMTWQVGDHGMRMTLASDVPELIARALRPFVLELFQHARLPIGRLRDCVLAVHPGGPKIIDQVRKILELDEAQVRTSRAVLFDCGNMSSATVPHIWMRMLADPGIPRGTLIPSLAFGPGLTICGALLEKR